MSAYILPNILLLAVVCVIAWQFAKFLPEARQQQPGNIVPVARLSFFYWFTGKLRAVWRFVLEAKGLRSQVGSRVRMKQLLSVNRKRSKTTAQSQTSPGSVGFGNGPIDKVRQVVTSPRKIKRKLAVFTGVEEQPITVVSLPAAVVGAAEGRLQGQTAEPKILIQPAHDALNTAKQYLDKRQYFEARKLLENMDGAQRNNPVYWARLGLAQYGLGSYAEATKSYERSIALDSSQPNRYYNLALAYKALGQVEKAVANLRQALVLSPDNPKYKETLASFSSQDI